MVAVGPSGLAVCGVRCGRVLWRGGSRPVGGSCCGSFSFFCGFGCFVCVVGSGWWRSRVLCGSGWPCAVVGVCAGLPVSGRARLRCAVPVWVVAGGWRLGRSVVPVPCWWPAFLVGCGCGAVGLSCGGFLRLSGLAAVGFGWRCGCWLVLRGRSRFWCLSGRWCRCWFLRRGLLPVVPVAAVLLPPGGGAVALFRSTDKLTQQATPGILHITHASNQYVGSHSSRRE